MNIKQVPGIGPLAPKPSSNSISKASKAEFDKVLDQAMKAEKAEKSGEADNAEKLKLIQNRIQAGYYDRPDIVETTADKLLDKGKKNG